MSKIIFTKIRNVKTPIRAYEYAAGIDFYIPEFSLDFISSLKEKNPSMDGNFSISWLPRLDGIKFVIEPGGRINIPSGIKVNIEDKSTCLLAANKSGVASKKGLNHLAELIDPDYQGEIHINLYNSGVEPVEICPGDKIIQFMQLPIVRDEWVAVDNAEFDSIPESKRSTGGFGSSGNT